MGENDYSRICETERAKLDTELKGESEEAEPESCPLRASEASHWTRSHGALGSRDPEDASAEVPGLGYRRVCCCEENSPWIPARVEPGGMLWVGT